MAEPLWLAESEVVSLIDLGEAISAVGRSLVELSAGAAVSMGKAQAKFPGGSLHATGAVAHGAGYAATKTWAHGPSGATPLLVLWSTESGELLAVIEAFALGQYRTAAVSGVATKALAPAAATELAVCGTGAQALMQVAAVTAVRDIRTVRVWSPRPESRRRFRDVVADALDVEVVDASDVATAVSGAHVVTLVTRAREPFLPSAALDGGTHGGAAHVNAIGAIGLERAEFEPDLLDRCGVVAVDDLTAARSFSAELRERFGDDEAAWARVSTLADVVAGTPPAAPRQDITLFKAMGLGLADLAIARFVHEQAEINGLGTPLPRPTRSRPRLRATRQEATTA
jgi:ornithine cyclodeaminase